MEEGKKYTEKIVAKHKEILESITELCGSLTELEEKLKVISEYVFSSDANKNVLIKCFLVQRYSNRYS